jgi:general secretion pathway protein J
MTTAVSSAAFRGSRGFTLLEVLVVMVIVSLISAVLIQGLGLVLNVRDNFGAQLFDLDRTTLARSRVTAPMEGLVADFDDGENMFAGTPDSVSGLTVTPLLRRAGRPTPFALTIEYDAAKRMNTLLYREDKDPPIALHSWEGQKADFRFIGDTTGWAQIWPPASAPPMITSQVIMTDIRPPQLPELIVLDTQSAREPVFAVAVQARRNRVPRDPIF